MTASSFPGDPGDPVWKHTILYHAARDALSPRTDAILRRLGYQLLLPETLERLRAEHPTLRAEMRVVDERRLDDLDADDDLPIVLLTGQQGAAGDDPRVVGAVKRPAGVHDLYRLMQQVFEEIPRATPRVETRLRARCLSRDREWEARILSLSENGCLIRSPEAILLGERIELSIDLPQDRSVALEAEATYQLLPDTGLVFSPLDPPRREALQRFVNDAILA